MSDTTASDATKNASSEVEAILTNMRNDEEPINTQKLEVTSHSSVECETEDASSTQPQRDFPTQEARQFEEQNELEVSDNSAETKAQREMPTQEVTQTEERQEEAGGNDNAKTEVEKRPTAQKDAQLAERQEELEVNDSSSERNVEKRMLTQGDRELEGQEEAEVDESSAETKAGMLKVTESNTDQQLGHESSAPITQTELKQEMGEPLRSIPYHRNLRGEVVGDYRGRDSLQAEVQVNSYNADDYRLERRTNMEEFLKYKTAPARSLVKQQEDLLQRLRSLRNNLERSEGLSDGAQAQSSALGSRLAWREEEISGLNREEPRHHSKGGSCLERYRQRKFATQLLEDEEGEYKPRYQSSLPLSKPESLRYSTEHATRTELRLPRYRLPTAENEDFLSSYMPQLNLKEEYTPGAYRERISRLLDEAAAPVSTSAAAPVSTSAAVSEEPGVAAYDRYWKRYGQDDTPYLALNSQQPMSNGLEATNELQDRSPSPAVFGEPQAQSEMQQIEAC